MSETRSSTDAPMDPQTILAHHRATGEPLDSDTKRILVEAGLTPAGEWSQRGGDLWWHAPSFPEPEDVEDLPVVAAGDSCPSCGGGIVVDATVRYSRVPIYADGTPTDEGQGGDFEFDGDPYCGDCGQRVRVEP